MKRREFVKYSGIAAGALYLMKPLNIPEDKNLKTRIMKISNPEKNNICVTCGTRYSDEYFDENLCPVCADDRQYINLNGQQWTSYKQMKDSHSLYFNKLRNDIYEISIRPSFAIGQKAHLILHPEGNVLWDCLPFLDEAAAAFIDKLGGLKAIAISHPHYYSLMAEWAGYFDCPVYLHENDRKWVFDKEDNIHFFSEDKLEITKGIEIVNSGGHFPGSTVLHYKSENQAPTLFGGDTLYLSLNKKHLSAMYSYPNNIALEKKELFRCFEKVKELDFDAFFGAFSWQNLFEGAGEIFKKSYERYRGIYS
ncbi:MBL fold metallo-hydrolase [Christiangramia fulva]|uniref:MBL fold metallo-hydrolase n=1 Tax=Christiangramia fulva TaxID=2126553 RepID=A0A2R3Z2F0_9FLAO|nr:MBL fold metallo-hydrolase [Christiangramia fulva]AVR44451.1 MBL fold metallo-hydrolase [Christiangramia fulva]